MVPPSSVCWFMTPSTSMNTSSLPELFQSLFSSATVHAIVRLGAPSCMIPNDSYSYGRIIPVISTNKTPFIECIIPYRNNCPLPVISTNKTPFIECIIPFITSYNYNKWPSACMFSSIFSRHSWSLVSRPGSASRSGQRWPASMGSGFVR